MALEVVGPATQERRGSRINTICAAAALIYALAAIAFATTTPNLGFTLLHTGAPIFGVDDASTGLHSGDRVIAIDGVNTTTREGRDLAWSRLGDKSSVTIEVARGNEHLVLTIPSVPGLPLDAVAGIALAFLLLMVSFVARYSLFQRVTALYVVTMAGVMLLPVVERVAILHLPFIVGSTLAAPATCHHMLTFPIGRPLSRRVLALLYIPAVGFILLISIDALSGALGLLVRRGVIASSIAWIAACLAIGSLVRRRRLQRSAGELDPIVVRWVYAGSAIIVGAMSIGVVWAIARSESFVGGGYRPIIAVTMAGGSACILMAIARQRLANDRVLRRGASALLIAGVATAMLFPILMVIGAARRVFAGSEMFVAVVGLAGLAMALLGARLQRSLDDRVAARRERAATLNAQSTIALVSAAAQTRVVALEKRVADLQKRIEVKRVSFVRTQHDALIGDGLRSTFQLVERVAPSDATVLIIGETGVGKEVVASAVHAASERRGKPFIVIDCSAIPAQLFEGMVFGHERGAFTGAVKSSLGLLRSADTGTVFLDEVGELPLELQAKLLRAIEAREVVAVGDVKPVPIDVRIVAGTNRDLDRMVAEGTFRADLLYRLRVVEIVVPPLRARRQDIPPLAASFLRALGSKPATIAREALDVLQAHDWPGNVRELRHVIESAALVCTGDEILAGDLRIDREVFRAKAREVLASSDDTGLRETLSTLERERLIRALDEHQGNQSAAAKALGMSRPALRRRLTRYAIQGRPR
ncbi:MAG TPA: sigma 54-interacting transcriptional regulator [Kofleriaceae bacterium]